MTIPRRGRSRGRDYSATRRADEGRSAGEPSPPAQRPRRLGAVPRVARVGEVRGQPGRVAVLLELSLGGTESTVVALLLGLRGVPALGPLLQVVLQLLDAP